MALLRPRVHTKPIGFAAMPEETQREIASKGGKAAHAKGVAHEYEAGSELAKAAGRKGGHAVARDRAHMAEIGRRGGQAKHARRGTIP
jgi:general stress protein YciG